MRKLVVNLLIPAGMAIGAGLPALHTAGMAMGKDPVAIHQPTVRDYPQDSMPMKGRKDSTPAAAGDSTKKRMPATAIKPYKEVITAAAKTSRGLLTAHQVGEKYYLEVADSLLGRELLVVARLSKSGAGVRSMMEGYAGDEVNEGVIRLEKGPGDKLFFRGISYLDYTGDSTTAMYRSVSNSNVQPILASFDIAAFGPDKKSVVIDATAFLNGDNDIFFFRPAAKTSFMLGGQLADRSYIEGISSYPGNTEIKVVKTYSRNNLPPATVELNTSVIMLPTLPMQPRNFDPRVGYFTVNYTDYDRNPQGVQKVEIIKRWRLEPRAEDMEKYRRGELVEPKKQIVFYIDPATPKKWVPYLIQGVNDWQGAFEAAGFKNAIVAREAPARTEDSTWSIEDARFSAIVYKPSPVSNAMGLSIADPRTGEILESHISWYHNVMALLRNWYMLQAGAIDPRARHMEFSDSLMGELIRFVSSHEVGHALGLRHNFGASSTVPVEKLRDRKWLEANGHTPSIMDYARFNYVAQPEDSVTKAGIYPRIGDYDKWAIEWGYRLFPQFKTPGAETASLNQWVIEKNKNPRLWFGTETNPDDPHSQNEDLGNNAMKAGAYGIKNLQRILPNLEGWTRRDNEDFDGLQLMYGELVTQFMRYMGHALKNIGGIYETPKTVEQGGPVYQVVPAKTQQEALVFLDKQLFTTPTWLFDTAIAARTGADPVAMVSGSQQQLLNQLLSQHRLQNLAMAPARYGAQAYALSTLLDQLQDDLFSELKTAKPTDICRRNLQKAYITQLGNLLNPKAPAPNQPGAMPGTGNGAASEDIKMLARASLRQLDAALRTATPVTKDRMTKLHWQDCIAQLTAILKPATS